MQNYVTGKNFRSPNKLMTKVCGINNFYLDWWFTGAVEPHQRKNRGEATTIYTYHDNEIIISKPV